MRRKILISLVSLCLAVVSVGTLFACSCIGSDDNTSTTHTHVFTKRRTTEQYLAEKATCVKQAKYYFSCEHCDQAGTETFSFGSLKDHDFTAKVIENKYLESSATCTQKAKYYYACSVCGKKGSKTFEYGELSTEHTYATSWTYDTNYHWHAATCGHNVTKDKSAHEFSGDVCSVCGYSKAVPISLDLTAISGSGITVDNSAKTIKLTVENSVAEYNFEGKLEHAIGASYEVYPDDSYSTPITSSAPLNVGKNTLYLRVTDGTNNRDYEVTVLRKADLTLTSIDGFDINSTDKTAKKTVENSVATYDFTDKFTYDATNVTVKIYKEDTHKTEITTSVNLKVDENKFYLVVQDKNITNYKEEYTITITRLDQSVTTYAVTFKSKLADGTESVISTQNVEQNATVTAPTLTAKEGYFYTWDYNFTNPITANITITATWEPDVLLSADGTTVTGLNNTSANLALVILNKYDGYSSSVTKIQAEAFKSNTTITSLTVQKGITEIGNYAFAECSNLAKIKLLSTFPWNTGVGTHIFENCTSLTSVDFGNMRQVGKYMFSGCTALTEFKSSTTDVIREIKDYAFEGCTSLVSISFSNKLAYIQIYAFSGCTALKSFTIPSSVNKTEANGSEPLGGNIFKNCTSLETVTFETTGIDKIPKSMFIGCSSLTSVVGMLNTSITKIEDYAFYGCNSLASIELPDTLTTIGRSVFYGCNSLRSITLPASLAKIGNDNDGNSKDSNTFYGCTNLIEVINKSTTITDIKAGETTYGYVALYAKVVKTSGDSSVTTSDNYLWYKDSETNAVSLIGYTGTDKSITLPTQAPTNLGGSTYLIGENAFKNNSSITSVTMDGGVTSIGDYAFYGCTGLKTVTIANTVTSIGYSAFNGCSALTNITIPGSVGGNLGTHAFENCSSLTRVTLENGVTTVSASAFNGCSALEDITIPSSVTKVGDSAFFYCSSLKAITLPNSVTSIGGSAFYNCRSLTSFSIPTNVTEIAGSVFSNCIGLTSMTIPSNITRVGANAFSGCTALNNLTIENGLNGLKNIGNSAFNGCTALTTVTLPNSVTTVDFKVFGNCVKLKSVTLSSNMTNISESMFIGCSALTSIIIPDSVTSISASAFKGCTNLTGIAIPDNVESIGVSAFYGTSLTSVSFGSGLTTIGANAFYGTSLTSVVFGSGLTTIGASAFYGTSLTSVVFGSGLTTIGAEAFYGCKGLTKVTVPSGVTTIGDKAFYGCYQLREVENHSSLEIYHGWRSNGYIAYYAIVISKSTISSVTQTDNSNGFVWYKVDSKSFLVGYIGEKKAITLPSKDYWDNTYKYIGASAFYNRSDLTSIVFPSDSIITEIRSSAFYGCTGLQTIDLPTSLTKIDVSAFENCTGLASITIPNGIKEINNYLFKGCTGLRTATINGPITRIGLSAFEGCTSLENLVLSDDSKLVTVDQRSFYGCSGLTSIVIPNTVTKIEDSAFEGCSALTSVTLSTEITYLSQGVFADCTSLTSIVIPQKVTVIRNYAFINCSNLKSIVIPSTVKNIWAYAFYHCDNLNTIFYGGADATAWSAITITNTYSSNAQLSKDTTTIYYYSDVAPSTTGNYWHYVSDVPTVWATV